MMRWIADETARKRNACFRLERLFDANDYCLGSVMQFMKDGPAYPVLLTGRLGAHEDFDAAKKAVEAAQA